MPRVERNGPFGPGEIAAAAPRFLQVGMNRPDYQARRQSRLGADHYWARAPIRPRGELLGLPVHSLSNIETVVALMLSRFATPEELGGAQ
jgi:hypothetical protein